jgi:hypothetical protein
MELFFKKIKAAFPKSISQFEKNYVSFSFAGGFYYQLRVQKNQVRMMAVNYPNKAPIGDCLKLLKQNKIEGKSINGSPIIAEVGVKNPEIVTIKIEIPYSGNQLADEKFINTVIDSCEKFHEAILPVLNPFQKKPLGNLRETMGGVSSPVNVSSSPKPQPARPASAPQAKDSSATLQQQLADALREHYPDATIKKIDKDNYLDIHIPAISEKIGTHFTFTTSRNGIKLSVYSKDDELCERFLNSSTELESATRGVRPKNNPSYSTVNEAIDGALFFINELTGSKKKSSVSVSSSKKTEEKNSDKRTLQTSSKESSAKLPKAEKTENDFKEMIKAYKKGDFQTVADFVEKGNPPLQFNQDESVIENELISVCAAEEVDLDVLERIIKRGDDLNARNIDDDKYTAIHYCAWDGKVEALSILLKSGASPDIVGGDGRTPLHLATAMGHSDAVALLLKAKIDINRRIPEGNKYYSSKGATALREALINQRWEVVDLLMEAGADISGLTEPCIESFKGKKDLFDVIRLLEEDGEYPDGNFDEGKLNELENKVKEIDEDEQFEQEEDIEDDDREEVVIDLEDFDVNEGKLIDFICNKIKKEKILTNLLYVNKALSAKGFDTDNHQAYFFDSSVLISDNEMQGFLLVNMDGFYSNCVNEEEMQMIFSWGGVNDIEYEEDGDDCSIDIVADQGRLTIKKEGSHSLKVLYSFYKNVWKAINDKFKDEPFIIWNDVWKMGIKEVGFKTPEDYFEFNIQENENLDEIEEEATVTEEEVEGFESNDDDLEDKADDFSFIEGKPFKKYFNRFLEIANKTGIHINKIGVEPDVKERDELWEITRVFADRIYQLDKEKNPDKNEIDVLCYFGIVALHWCDLMVDDKRFSYSNGRFRRDTIALALCFYARIDREFKYYDHIKNSFILPHMQFSVLMWTINIIVTLGQDVFFGMFTPEQVNKAQELFKELSNKNNHAGFVDPDEMPDNHPLKNIWREIFHQFINVRIPYQFIKNYINPTAPSRSFLGKLFSANKEKIDPRINVCLGEGDKQKNLEFLELQIAHKQFPDDWDLYEDLALVYIYFASTAESDLSGEVQDAIFYCIREWSGDEESKALNKLISESIKKAEIEFNKDKSKERFEFALESIRRHFYVKFDYDQEKTIVQLKLVATDLIKIAEVDNLWEDAESELFQSITNEWGVSFEDDSDEE